MASNEVDRVAKMSKDELCDYLKCKDLDPEAVETVKQNRLSGATFLELSKEHLKELFPVVGDRIAVSKLLESLKVSSTYTGTDHSNVRKSSNNFLLLVLINSMCMEVARL